MKLGELAPQGEDAPPVPPQDPQSPKQDAPKAPRKRAAKAKSKTAKTSRTPAALLAEAREATAEWTDDAINAEAIRTTLHCSAANSRVLRDLLLSERADGRRLHPVDSKDDRERRGGGGMSTLAMVLLSVTASGRGLDGPRVVAARLPEHRPA